jgi:hypothetical protein
MLYEKNIIYVGGILLQEIEVLVDHRVKVAFVLYHYGAKWDSSDSSVCKILCGIYFKCGLNAGNGTCRLTDMHAFPVVRSVPLYA